MKQGRKVGQPKRQEAGVMERVKKIGDHGKTEWSWMDRKMEAEEKSWQECFPLGSPRRYFHPIAVLYNNVLHMKI